MLSFSILCPTGWLQKFWMDEETESIPREERMVIGVDVNAYVSEGKRGDEGVIGRFGVK